MSLLSWLTKTVDSDTEIFLPSPSRGPELGVPSSYISKELDKPVSESTVRSIRDRHKRRVLKVKWNTMPTDKDVKFAESTLSKENGGDLCYWVIWINQFKII